MKLQHVAFTITGLVVASGLAMISPLFFQAGNAPARRVMLSFSVSGTDGIADWCRSLSSLLSEQSIEATVFITGKTAEQNPGAVSCFGDAVDIGSSTYNGGDLTRIEDYSLKLQNVREGKMAVDLAGGLYSRIFEAPYGATDQDIYSLLTRAEILADFSYQGQYNVYENGQFIRYSAAGYFASDYPPDFFSTLPRTADPIIINFDNSFAISGIRDVISSLRQAGAEFVNASTLTGLELTVRSEEGTDGTAD